MIKRLEEIRQMLKERNDKWYKEERPDIDLKYVVPTDCILDALKDYEIGITEELNNLINEKNKDYNYFTWYDETSYYDELVEKEQAKFWGSDNTYNHSGNVQNDFNWATYELEDNKYIVIISFHLGGDIRGNYTDNIVLQFDYDTGFEDLIQSVSYEYGLTFELEVDNIIYEVTPFAFDECYEVYDRNTDDYIYGVWGIDDTEVKECIRKEIKEMEEEKDGK